MFRDGAAIYNNAGEQVGHVALDESAVGVVVTDRAVFVRLADRVEKYSLGGQAAR